MRTVEIARLDDVPEGEARSFTMDGMDVVLCNVEGEIYALQSMCTHEDLPLDGGEVDDGVLTCEWHGAQFDVCSGAVRGIPATKGLRTYDTEVRDGRVYLILEEESPAGRAAGVGTR